MSRYLHNISSRLFSLPKIFKNQNIVPKVKSNMALMTRIPSRCGQYLGEYFKFTSRFISSTNVKYNTTTTESKTSESAPPPSEIESKLKTDVDNMTKEVEQLTEKNKELMDKYKRALADGENLRIRMTKQIQDAKIFGIQNFCKDLLEVADVLNKATESVPKEEIDDKNPHLKNLYEGLIMTEAQLKSVFKRHGLEKVDPLNEKFNPNLHEALFQQDVQGKDSGTVVVVSKIGYKLHDRVIRPALVGVAK